MAALIISLVLINAAFAIRNVDRKVF